jgi:hypothetical protein
MKLEKMKPIRNLMMKIDAQQRRLDEVTKQHYQLIHPMYHGLREIVDEW